MVNKIKSSALASTAGASSSTAGSWSGSKAKTKVKAKKQDHGQDVFLFSPGPKQRPELPNTMIIKILRMAGYVGDDPVELARGKRKRDVLRGSITKKFSSVCSSPTEDSSSSSPTEDTSANPKTQANNTVNASVTLNPEEQDQEQAMVMKTYDQLVQRFIINPPHDPCQTSFSYKIRAIKILVNKLAEADTPPTSLVNPGLTRSDIRTFFLSLISTKNNPSETYELSDGYLTEAERARLILTTIPEISCNEKCCDPREPSEPREPREPCGQKEKQQE